MVKRGMLADAQTKSLLGEERGKDIIQNNWKFLIEYFHKERVDWFPHRVIIIRNDKKGGVSWQPLDMPPFYFYAINPFELMR